MTLGEAAQALSISVATAENDWAYAKSWLRFNESSNSVSLYNRHSGKFGPAKRIGSPGSLSDGEITIDLSDIIVSAAGPNSPTVTLTFSLQFLSNQNRHFTIDVAASNDVGFIGDFVAAGTLDVLRRR